MFGIDKNKILYGNIEKVDFMQKEPFSVEKNKEKLEYFFINLIFYSIFLNSSNDISYRIHEITKNGNIFINKIFTFVIRLRLLLINIIYQEKIIFKKKT